MLWCEIQPVKIELGRAGRDDVPIKRTNELRELSSCWLGWHPISMMGHRAPRLPGGRLGWMCEWLRYWSRPVCQLCPISVCVCVMDHLFKEGANPTRHPGVS